MADEQVTKRKACISCHKEFTGSISECPDDGTLLTPLDEESLVGKVLANKYEILSLSGEGGMGRVYKGRHKLMKRTVAVKTLHRNLVASAATLKRFQQEAESLSMLSHPNLITVYDFGLTDEGQPYLVMDYLEGQGLDEVLNQCGTLSPEKCLPYFVQSCNGLAHAHKKGVVHRDIKPSNIMLVQDEEEGQVVKILDFGIAKRLPKEGEELTNLTQTGDVFGSPLYMSPEQCRARDVDGRTDIYSLGCVLFQCLTGRTPFSGGEFVEILMKHVSESPPSLADACPGVTFPSGTQDLLSKAMAKNREERFQSMAEFREAMEAVFAGEGFADSVSSDGGKDSFAAGDEASSPEFVQTVSESVKEAGMQASGQPAGKKLSPLKAVVAAGAVLVVIVFIFIQTGSISLPSWLGGNPVKHALAMAQKSYDAGNYQEARQYARDAESLAEKKGGQSDELASSLYLIGMVNYAQGDYPAARDYLEKALSMRKKLNGDVSAETALVEVALGRTDSALGQAARAQQMLEPAVNIIQGAYGSADLHTADALSALADSYLRQGKYGDAIEKLNQAVSIRENKAGRESALTANSYNDLGQAYQLSGNNEEAASLYSKALEIRKKALGKDNPQVADTLICLAALAAKKGDFKHAADLFKQALGIQEKNMGPANPTLAQTRRLYENARKRAEGSPGGSKGGMILEEVKGR